MILLRFSKSIGEHKINEVSSGWKKQIKLFKIYENYIMIFVFYPIFLSKWSKSKIYFLSLSRQCFSAFYLASVIWYDVFSWICFRTCYNLQRFLVGLLYTCSTELLITLPRKIHLFLLLFGSWFSSSLKLN